MFDFTILSADARLTPQQLREYILNDEASTYPEKTLTFAINVAHVTIERAVWLKARNEGFKHYQKLYPFFSELKLEEEKSDEIDEWTYKHKISRPELIFLEGYLAAHAVTVAVPDPKHIKSDSYSVMFNLPQSGDGLRQTRYGRDAITRDPTNGLAELASNASVPDPVSHTITIIY